MRNRKIHYLHPTHKHDACGLGGNSLTVELTDNIDAVTCQHCLNTVAGKKRSGGRSIKGAEPKVTIWLRIDKGLRDKAKAKNLNCSKLLEQAIAKHQ